MSNSDKPIDLDSSVSEQIADMQLLRLRQTSMMRELSLDEVRILESLTKVKSLEEEKRKLSPKEIKKLKTEELKRLAQIEPEKGDLTSESKEAK